METHKIQNLIISSQEYHSKLWTYAPQAQEYNALILPSSTNYSKTPFMD